jgi:hypothetical protein
MTLPTRLVCTVIWMTAGARQLAGIHSRISRRGCPRILSDKREVFAENSLILCRHRVEEHGLQRDVGGSAPEGSRSNAPFHHNCITILGTRTQDLTCNDSL